MYIVNQKQNYDQAAVAQMHFRSLDPAADASTRKSTAAWRVSNIAAVWVLGGAAELLDNAIHED